MSDSRNHLTAGAVSPTFSNSSSWRVSPIPSFLELPRAANCGSRSVVGRFQEYTTVYPLWCNSWQCTRCAARLTTLWSIRVADAKPERMVTLTQIGDTREDIRRSLQLLIRKLRRDGVDFQYWGVVELHRSLKPHMHLLQRGAFIPKWKLQHYAHQVGMGWTDVRKLSSGWSAARYCAKHLGHSHGRRWNGRLIRYSRGFFPKTKKQLKEERGSDGWEWEVVFGRANVVCEKLRSRGEDANYHPLGLDWIMGEENVGGQIVRRYVRDEKKGYGRGSGIATSGRATPRQARYKSRLDKGGE